MHFSLETGISRGKTEAPIGIEPMHEGFADLSLTTWARRLVHGKSITGLHDWQGRMWDFPQLYTLAWLLPKGLNVMRDARDLSARTGEAMRWFIYTFTLLLPWLSFFLLGPWATLFMASSCVGFWLWWVYPPIGLNRRPATWLLTFLVIVLGATALLLATEQLQSPTTPLF